MPPSFVELEPDEQALAAELNAALADELEAEGWLCSPAWRAALEQVPRHHFVPRFEVAAGLGGGSYDGTDPTQREAWLRKVYENKALITRTGEHDIPTSSCSAPAVVLGMLELLEVEEGHAVLEIGTGTGWNAGLLAARLGSEVVTSVDRQDELVDEARERLRSLGLEPTLIAHDGLRGHEARAPYDRIIGTCAVRAIPTAWLTQTRPGGVILVDVRNPDAISAAGRLVRLTVGEEGTAHGRFRREAFSFMPLRSPGGPADIDTGPLSGEAVTAPGVTRETSLDPEVLDDASFAFFAQLSLPGMRPGPVSLVDGPTWYCLIHPCEGAWARVREGEVTQAGPRRLWDELEAAHERWRELGEPDPWHFALTVTPEGTQQVTLEGAPDVFRLPL